MRRTALTLAIAAAGLSAQSKPSLAGAWVPVPEAGTDPRATEITIRQTPAELVIESASGRKMTYKLDGSPSSNTIPERGGDPPTVAASTAAWDGSKLVIQTAISRGVAPNIRTIHFKTVYFLDADGRLILEESASLAEGGPTDTRKVVFRKKTAALVIAIGNGVMAARSTVLLVLHYPLPITNYHCYEQLTHRQSRHGIAHLRRDFGQRLQYETTIPKSGVRHIQSGRLHDPIAVQNQIQIERP
jgi:hypothetical protein